MFCAATLALACSFAYGQATGGRVRRGVGHADTPAVNMYINGCKVLANLPLRECSEYLALPAGSYNVDIKVTGTGTSVK